MSDTINVAMVQQRCSDSRTDNMAKTITGIRKAASEGANLVVLQALHCHPYFCQVEDYSYFELAETIPGPSTDQLGALARELDCVIVASLFEKRAAGLFHNTAVVLDTNGTIAGRYRSMHIPQSEGVCEGFYFTPGDYIDGVSGFEPIETALGKLGVLLSWDQWFPESARMMVMAGAELLLCPAAAGWRVTENEQEQARQLESWLVMQRAQAIANAVPLVVVNRVGYEELAMGMEFWGRSFVLGPQGEYLYQASKDSELVAVVPIDMARAGYVRRRMPFLRDRRVDAFGNLAQRYLDRR